MIAGLIICASLTAVDCDTVKWDGQNMRLLGKEFRSSPASRGRRSGAMPNA